MAGQRHNPEQSIAKFRQAEIELSKDTAEVCRLMASTRRPTIAGAKSTAAWPLTK
jgi:hypothetical protein